VDESLGGIGTAGELHEGGLALPLPHRDDRAELAEVFGELGLPCPRRDSPEELDDGGLGAVDPERVR